MTAVIAAADLPSTGCVPGSAALRLSRNSSTGSTREQFIDSVAELLEREQTVICVYPSWHAKPAERDIRMARILLDTERVVGVRSDLPPLALSLTVDLLAHLAQHVPPGILIATAARLAKQMTAGSWLRSVTRFQHAPTSLADHMRSYLPSGAFVATIVPEPQVSRARRDHALRWRPPDPVYLLVAPAGGDQGWVRGHLVPRLRPAKVQSLPSQPLSTMFWGCKQVVEYVAFSAHPQALTTAVRSVRYRPCSWCRELVSSDPCPFCRMSASGAAFQPSHALPDTQQLPTTPLVNAAAGAEAPVESTHRSSKP